MILFWFLLVALALAWGIADWQQDQLAHRAPPPVVQKSAPTVAAAQAPLAPPASPAPAGGQDGAATPVADSTAAAKPVAADSEPPKADDQK